MRANPVFPGLVMSAALVASAMAITAVPVLANDTITVNSIYDGADASGGSGECDANESAPGLQCTLRAAIQTANANADLDTIEFGFGGSEVKTIKIKSALPKITQPVVIDGYSAPNTRVNSRTSGSNAKLRIVLKGPGNGSFDGLEIAAPATIKGLVFQQFMNAIFVSPGGEGSFIQGNFIGTTANGLGRARTGGPRCTAPVMRIVRYPYLQGQSQVVREGGGRGTGFNVGGRNTGEYQVQPRAGLRPAL